MKNKQQTLIYYPLQLFIYEQVEDEEIRAYFGEPSSTAVVRFFAPAKNKPTGVLQFVRYRNPHPHVRPLRRAYVDASE